LRILQLFGCVERLILEFETLVVYLGLRKTRIKAFHNDIINYMLVSFTYVALFIVEILYLFFIPNFEG